MGHPRGNDEGVAGADLEARIPDGEAVAAGLDEGRLHVRVAVGEALAAGGEGELDEHQLRAVGEHGPGDPVAGVDRGEAGGRKHGRAHPCGPSLAISAARSCSSAAVSSVSGGRTGPAPCPTMRAPALTIETA